MTAGTYTGTEIKKALKKGRYDCISESSNTAVFTYTNPTGKKKYLNVPLNGPLQDKVLETIAEQAGFNGIDEFTKWVDSQI